MIIGIAGAAGSGKSTSAEVLVDEFGYTRGRFAGALKSMLRAFLAYRGASDELIDRLIDGDLKELPTALLNGRSPREFMQWLGEWGRREVHLDLWVDTEFEANDDADKLLFDDLRHDNEEEAIRKRGGLVLQLVGRSKDVNDHVSEHFVPTNPAEVINNTGTIGQLQDKVRRFARDVSWIDA